MGATYEGLTPMQAVRAHARTCEKGVARSVAQRLTQSAEVLEAIAKTFNDAGEDRVEVYFLDQATRLRKVAAYFDEGSAVEAKKARLLKQLAELEALESDEQ